MSMLVIPSAHIRVRPNNQPDLTPSDRVNSNLWTTLLVRLLQQSIQYPSLDL